MAIINEQGRVENRCTAVGREKSSYTSVHLIRVQLKTCVSISETKIPFSMKFSHHGEA